jgi:hypothetical protein
MLQAGDLLSDLIGAKPLPGSERELELAERDDRLVEGSAGRLPLGADLGDLLSEARVLVLEGLDLGLRRLATVVELLLFRRETAHLHDQFRTLRVKGPQPRVDRAELGLRLPLLRLLVVGEHRPWRHEPARSGSGEKPLPRPVRAV